MELLKLIKTRRSIRRFNAGKKVEEEKIEAILDAAIYAPSAGNIQPWKFYVVLNENIKQELSVAACGQKFISRASHVIVVCIDKEEASSNYGTRGENLYSIQDTAAAIQNMLLMIHNLGLASCWVGAFSETNVSNCLKLEKELRPVAIIPVGYPLFSLNPPPHRKFLDDVVKWVE